MNRMASNLSGARPEGGAHLTNHPETGALCLPSETWVYDQPQMPKRLVRYQ